VCKETRIAERLAILRKAKGLTQRQLAEKIGIERSTYAYYECGRLPSVDILARIYRVLAVSMDYVAGLREEVGYVTAEGSALSPQ